VETRITCPPPERLKILTPQHRLAYEQDGFTWIDGLIDADWLERLYDVTMHFVEESRTASRDDRRFDLEPDHTPEAPRIRRLNSPVDQHKVYWEFATQSVIVDLVEDLIGPDIKFHHGKLNFKAPHGGEEVRWHQDIQFWPHTNYGPLTVGVFLSDVEPAMGNVGFVPGSHEGELFDQYDGDTWVGCLSDRDLVGVPTDTAIYPTGCAGTVTVHNCRTIHGSAPNRSARQRPLLLQTYAPADAFTYTDLLRGSPHGNELIRGRPARWARHDPRPCQVGPTRARTIFEVQQRES
jgi:ectoine hydroxylase